MTGYASMPASGTLITHPLGEVIIIVYHRLCLFCGRTSAVFTILRLGV
jgi:hypothetical protein